MGKKSQGSKEDMEWLGTQRDTYSQGNMLDTGLAGS